MKNKFLQFCAFFFLFLNTTQAQDAQKIDSLLAIYSNEQSADTLKIKVLGNLYRAYLYSDIEKSKEYLSKALALSKQINYEKGIVDCQFRQGVLFELTDELDSAFVYYSKAKEYYQEINDIEGLQKSRTNLASIAAYQGDSEFAIKTLKENIELLQTQQNKEEDLGIDHELLSRVYDFQGYYKLSLEHALTSLRMFEKSNSELRKPDALNRIGEVELSLKNFPNAVDYANAAKSLQQSLDLVKDIDSPNMEAGLLANFGLLESKQNNFESAINFYQKSLDIYQDLGFAYQLADINKFLGMVNVKFGKPEIALPFLNQSLIIADSIDGIRTLRESHLYRAEAY